MPAGMPMHWRIGGHLPRVKDIDVAGLGDVSQPGIALHVGEQSAVVAEVANFVNALPPCVDACLVVPAVPEAPWQPLLRQWTLWSTVRTSVVCPGRTLPYKHVHVYRTRPACAPGIVPRAELPAQIASLSSISGKQTGLSFVFASTLAGLPCTTLWDSGAAQSFVSASFVQRHGLFIDKSAPPVPVAIASGELVQPLGKLSAKLRVQSYFGSPNLVVLDLAPGIDVILGDDWSQAHGVMADYGMPAQSGQPAQKPALHIRTKKAQTDTRTSVP